MTHYALPPTHPTAAAVAFGAYFIISNGFLGATSYPDQVHPLIWMLCLCPPFLIAAFMLMRDGLASFFPW